MHVYTPGLWRQPTADSPECPRGPKRSGRIPGDVPVLRTEPGVLLKRRHLTHNLLGR
jgi:hypothetical protein